MKPNVCKDWSRPGCLVVPDDRYTMRFDDIGEPPILWCAWCGPQAQAMDAIIQKAFAERPNFATEFKDSLDRHLPRDKRP